MSCDWPYPSLSELKCSRDQSKQIVWWRRPALAQLSMWDNTVSPSFCLLKESLNCFSPGDSEDAVRSWRGQRLGSPLPNILSAIRPGFKYYFKCLYIAWMFALACQECQMGSVCTLGAFLLISFQHASTAEVFDMISNSISTQVPSVCTYCTAQACYIPCQPYQFDCQAVVQAQHLSHKWSQRVVVVVAKICSTAV